MSVKKCISVRSPRHENCDLRGRRRTITRMARLLSEADLLLSAKRGFTSTEIAKRFNIGTRQARRDMLVIEAAFKIYRTGGSQPRWFRGCAFTGTPEKTQYDG